MLVWALFQASRFNLLVGHFQSKDVTYEPLVNLNWTPVELWPLAFTSHHGCLRSCCYCGIDLWLIANRLNSSEWKRVFPCSINTGIARDGMDYWRSHNQIMKVVGGQPLAGAAGNSLGHNSTPTLTGQTCSPLVSYTYTSLKQAETG